MSKLLRYLFLFFSVVSWSQVCSTLLYPVSLEEKCQYASLIVYGEVTSSETTWDDKHDNIYTISTLKVYESIKGNPIGTLQLAVQGGQVGDRIQMNSNTPRLEEGSEGVFFLKPSSAIFNDIESTYKLATSIQGFIRLDTSNGTLHSVFDHFSSVEELKSNIGAQVTTGWKQIQLRPKTSKSVFQTNETPVITNFTPVSITAGTKSVLTINGSDFGDNQGEVGFRDADEGGAVFRDALDVQVLSWSNTQIQVEVPFFAGNGGIRITNTSDEAGFSTTPLEVLYSLSNFQTATAVFQPFLNNNNGNGGYDYIYHEEFAASDALPFFEEAFEFWKCETGINFTYSGTTTNDTTTDDGVSVVRFDNGDELEPGVLGAVIGRVNGTCPFDNLGLVSEQDYIWNDDINWHFGAGAPNFNQVDFKTVALHEHGHAHQLGHVIDNNAVMHFSTGFGQVRYELSNNDRDAAQFAINKFLEGSLCGGSLMTIVADEEAPEFNAETLPADQDKELNTNEVYFLEDFVVSVEATDNCDEEITFTQSPIEGTSLGVGDHIITITAVDSNNNETPHNFTITVTDAALSIEEVNDQSPIRIFPNPVVDELTIEGVSIIKATLIGINGASLMQFFENTIDMSTYATGVYFLRIEIEGREFVQKLIKN